MVTTQQDYIIDERTPDQILMEMEEYHEENNPFQEKALTLVRTLNNVLDFINNAKDKQCATLGVIYALKQHQLVNGMSTRKMAQKINVSHGTISWYSKEFEKFNNENLS